MTSMLPRRKYYSFVRCMKTHGRLTRAAATKRRRIKSNEPRVIHTHTCAYTGKHVCSFSVAWNSRHNESVQIGYTMSDEKWPSRHKLRFQRADRSKLLTISKIKKKKKNIIISQWLNNLFLFIVYDYCFNFIDLSWWIYISTKNPRCIKTFYKIINDVLNVYSS